MHRIGIFQGRLSPVDDGKIQTFPAGTWREEFALAAECGFELLEWVFDAPDWTGNPIVTDAGRKEIRELQRTHGVAVPVVCGDYFMTRPLTDPDPAVRAEALGVLVNLVRHAPSIGMTQIELPCIGAASLKAEAASAAAVGLFRDLCPLLEAFNVSLLLEVDLAPPAVSELFSHIESERIRLNYDTGNSAYWGFDPAEEFARYGRLIRNVHIKDVTLAEYSVPLGAGIVDFDLSFALLKQAGYQGDFILQTARGDDHAALARRFASFTRRYVEQYFG